MEKLVCPEPNCGRKFSRRFNLNRHYQNFHLNNELVEKCFLCGQMFESCEQLQKHYRRSHRPSRKFFLKESAFRKAFVTYRYNFLESEINYASSQLDIKDKLKDLILSEAAKKTVCKVSLVLIAQMSMVDHSGETITKASIPFRSPGFLASAISPRAVKKNIIKSFNSQAQSIDEFIKSGSNWEYSRSLCFDVEFSAVRPITGGSTAELNIKSFRGKKFLYNPINKNEKCFLYCIAHYLFEEMLTSDQKKQKDELKYKKYVKKFNTENISFPISISGIKKFLKQNKNLDLKVNILHRTIDDFIFPLEYGLGCGKKTVNLLMVQRQVSNHFLLITNPNKYLRKVYNSPTAKKAEYSKEYFCLHCLSSFSKPDVLQKHETLCILNSPKSESVPAKGSKYEKIKFKNLEKQHKLEYTAYLDFECVLPTCDTYCHSCERLKCKCDSSFTDVLSKQKPIAFSFLVLGPNKKIIHEYSYAGEDAHIHLVEHLLEQQELWIENLVGMYKPLIMTRKDLKKFESEEECYLCGCNFENKDNIKCRDHSHYNGKFLGAACQVCNLRRRKWKKIPIFMHNGSRFDLHFIVKALGHFGEKIQNLSILPYNGENFRTLSFNRFEFIDSLAFLQSSLAELATDLKNTNHDYSILRQTNLVKTNVQFDQEKLDMILEKSFFPYEYCKSLGQMYSIKKLPKIKHFYSQLSEKSISKEEHKFAKKVWKKFGCRHLVDYTQIYCKIDVLILSELFEAFRDEMINFSGLDPAHYISLPAYSYDSMLKTTKAVIELPTDINMVHFLENCKRGGMSVIGTRHLQATSTSNSRRKRINPGVESEIVYVDANVRYHFSQIQFLFFTF